MKKELHAMSLKRFYKNKVVVITGGAGGLGQALLNKMFSYGAKVALLDLDFPTEPLQIEASPSSNILQLECDICDLNQVTITIDKIIDLWGTVDVLVNNAGIAHMSRFEDTELSLIMKIMDVNFMGSINVTHVCLPYIQKSKGHIVAISSVAGFTPLYGRTAYAASKHALEGFFESLEAEQLEYGVNVSVICPSFVATRPELTVSVNDGVSSPGAPKKHPVGGSLTPEQAALAICKSIAKNKNKLYLGFISKIARVLYTLVPKFYRDQMIKSARKELE